MASKIKARVISKIENEAGIIIRMASPTISNQLDTLRKQVTNAKTPNEKAALQDAMRKQIRKNNSIQIAFDEKETDVSKIKVGASITITIDS